MCRAHALIIEGTQGNTYDAAFQLKALDLAIQEGNRDSAHGANELMRTRWRRQHEELIQCKNTT